MKLLFVMLMTMFLTACAEFRPTDGMNRDQLNKMSMASGNGGLVLVSQANGYEIYQNASIANQKKLAAQGNIISKALVTPEKDVYFVFKGGNLVLSGASGPEIDKFVKSGFASKADLQFGDSIGASGSEVGELKKYGINNTADFQKLKTEFDKSKSLYGNDSSTKNIVTYLSDREAAKSQKTTLAQYIQKKQADEKRAKDLAASELQSQSKALEEKRKNMKLTSMFLCIDKLGANRDKGLAENLMSAAADGDFTTFGYMIRNTTYAQFCDQVTVPFNDMKTFNSSARLYQSKNGVDYYLVSDAYKTWGIMGN